MNKNKVIRAILEKILIGFSAFILYSSVLVEILFPMLLISGIFVFLQNFYWISWFCADPSILGTDIRISWLNAYINSPFFSSYSWDILKILLFIVGISLFVISLITLVVGIKKEGGLVNKVVYKYIRHPQIFSIIIFTFPLFLYEGFRIGNFVSWAQFIFLMIIYSDIGDMKLNKKYPKEFQQYYTNTGFFLPRIIPYRISYYFSAISNKKCRYPLLFLIYIFFMFGLRQTLLILPLSWKTI